MKGLVIDLRGNPGEDLDAALRLADDFLEVERPSQLCFCHADGDPCVVRLRGGDPYRMPLAIIVHRQTASAAELFAGALAVMAGHHFLGRNLLEVDDAAPFAFRSRGGGVGHGGVLCRGVTPQVEIPRTRSCPP